MSSDTTNNGTLLAEVEGIETDVFDGDGIRIKLKSHEDFNKIRESLTRIGVPAKGSVLWQSCHILHRQGEYAILHFKEMFAQDGRPSTMTHEDYGRRNRIALLLEEWGLCELIDKADAESNVSHLGMIKILSYADKKNWSLKPKYMMRADKARARKEGGA